MSARDYRKKAMRIRTLAIEQPRTEARDSYFAVANIYDGLARALESLSTIERDAAALSLPRAPYQLFKPQGPRK